MSRTQKQTHFPYTRTTSGMDEVVTDNKRTKYSQPRSKFIRARAAACCYARKAINTYKHPFLLKCVCLCSHSRVLTFSRSLLFVFGNFCEIHIVLNVSTCIYLCQLFHTFNLQNNSSHINDRQFKSNVLVGAILAAARM
jgi:hypothetical protein